MWRWEGKGSMGLVYRHCRSYLGIGNRYKKADAGHRLLIYTARFKLVELERVPYETPRGLLWLSSASLVHQIDIRNLKH